jgi:hypothetical protein
MTAMPSKRTRGDRAIDWIEEYCRVPSGPGKGQHVVLGIRSQFARSMMRRHLSAIAWLAISRPI